MSSKLLYDKVISVSYTHLFAQPTTATRTSTYDGARNYTKGNMVLVRNIALSYTVPQKFLKDVYKRQLLKKEKLDVRLSIMTDLSL